jgi:hypothetical protein
MVFHEPRRTQSTSVHVAPARGQGRGGEPTVQDSLGCSERLIPAAFRQLIQPTGTPAQVHDGQPVMRFSGRHTMRAPLPDRVFGPKPIVSQGPVPRWGEGSRIRQSAQECHYDLQCSTQYRARERNSIWGIDVFTVTEELRPRQKPLALRGSYGFRQLSSRIGKW